MTMSVRHLGFLAGLGLAFGPALRADAPLASTSPFLPPDSAGATAAAENTPLELRGILVDGGGYRFSIYDPARHTGQWVRLNEPGHDFTVRAHDVARDTVTLDFQGRTLTLPLHAAKVVGVAVTEPTSGPVPNSTAFPSGAGPLPKPPTPEEAARYSRAMDEINRRRAAREKSPVSMQMPVPGPVPR
jgi:hypothetical protein